MVTMRWYYTCLVKKRKWCYGVMSSTTTCLKINPILYLSMRIGIWMLISHSISKYLPLKLILKISFWVCRCIKKKNVLYLIPTISIAILSLCTYLLYIKCSHLNFLSSLFFTGTQSLNEDSLAFMSLSAIQLCKFQIGELVHLRDLKQKRHVCKNVWPITSKSLLSVQVSRHGNSFVCTFTL